MNEDYDLDFLEKAFQNHDEQFIESLKKAKENHKKNYPDGESQYDEFSLARALLTIVKKLKNITS